MNQRFRLALAIAAVSSSVAAAPDGYPDPTFGLNGRQTVSFDLGASGSKATALAVLPNGRILLAGVVWVGGGNDRIGLARLETDGQPDAGFGIPAHLPPGLSWAVPYDMAVQTDGRVVVAGMGYPLGLDSARALVCRFLPDGSLDTGFAAALPNLLAGSGCRALSQASSQFSAVALQPDGRIALAGTIMSANVAHGLVARLDAQGNLDDSFDADGVNVLLPQSIHATYLEDIAVTPDGDLVAVGYASINGNDNWQVFRLRGEDGGPDTGFDTDGLKPIAIDLVAGGDDYAVGVSVLPDGRIVVGGSAAGSDNTRCPAVARLQPDGQFDNTLDGDGLFADIVACLAGAIFNDMLVQSNDRIVLAGSRNGQFTAYRFLPQGGRDPSFGFLGSATVGFESHYGVEQSADTAYSIASHGGRLLLAGHASPDGVGSDFAITRLDNDLIFADDLE